MSRTIKLRVTNIHRFPKEVNVPVYDRSNIKTGIVHVGVGNFHRAHQAYYTDKLLALGATDWGICGIGLLPSDVRMYRDLISQDGLYTLVVKDPEGQWDIRVIGSILEYLFAPEDPETVIEKMSEPDVKIISLTITEGGYNFDAATGDFMLNEPAIQRDLKNPENPKTIFGYLTQAMKLRSIRELPGLTLLSCDNIQHNGDVLKKMLISYMKEAEPGIIEWTEANLTFPNSMVDRITPVSSPTDINMLKDRFGIEDRCPVVCEPFIQWVIEENFAGERPAWERTGVQFVHEVSPYENMKIRLLNAGHSLLGFTGSLFGFTTIDETVRDPLVTALLRKFMDEEVTPLLGNLTGIDLEKYKDSLIRRFGNPNIGDRLSRICAESSAKIPKFLLPTIREQLEREGPIEIGTFIVTAWFRYLELANTEGYKYEILDAMADEILYAVKASTVDNPLAFLKIKNIFGTMTDSSRFVETYIEMIDKLRENRIQEIIKQLIC